MTGMGRSRLWEGSGRKYSIQREVLNFFFILERGPEFFVSFKAPKILEVDSNLIRFDPIAPPFNS